MISSGSNGRSVRHWTASSFDYIAAAIARSALDQTSVTLTVYDELAGETSVTGVVKKMDQQLQRIKVASGDNIEWIPFEDVLNIE